MKASSQSCKNQSIHLQINGKETFITFPEVVQSGTETGSNLWGNTRVADRDVKRTILGTKLTSSAKTKSLGWFAAEGLLV